MGIFGTDIREKEEIIKDVLNVYENFIKEDPRELKEGYMYYWNKYTDLLEELDAYYNEVLSIIDEEEYPIFLSALIKEEGSRATLHSGMPIKIRIMREGFKKILSGYGISIPKKEQITEGGKQTVKPLIIY